MTTNVAFRTGVASNSPYDANPVTDLERIIAARPSLNTWLDFRSTFYRLTDGQLRLQDRAPKQGNRMLRTFGPGALPVINTYSGKPALTFSGSDVGIAGHLPTDLSLNKTAGTIAFVYAPTKATTQAIVGSHQGAGETNADLVLNIGFTSSGSNLQIPRFFDGNFNNRAFVNTNYQNTVHVYIWCYDASGIYLYVDGVRKINTTTGAALGGLTDGGFQIGRGFESSSNKVRQAMGSLLAFKAFDEAIYTDPTFMSVVTADLNTYIPT